MMVLSEQQRNHLRELWSQANEDTRHLNVVTGPERQVILFAELIILECAKIPQRNISPGIDEHIHKVQAKKISTAILKHFGVT